MTSCFRSLRKNGLGYSKTENERIIYDDLSFIRYIIDYCGAISSPDHSTQKLIKFRKGVFSINGDVMVLRIDYRLRIRMDVDYAFNWLSLMWRHRHNYCICLYSININCGYDYCRLTTILYYRSLRIVLLLTTYDLAVDKFDFAPVQSPDMRSWRCKKILQGDEPQKLSVKFFFWGGRGNFGGQK